MAVTCTQGGARRTAPRNPQLLGRCGHFEQSHFERASPLTSPFFNSLVVPKRPLMTARGTPMQLSHPPACHHSLEHHHLHCSSRFEDQKADSHTPSAHAPANSPKVIY
jgi:hypothetical protein